MVLDCEADHLSRSTAIISIAQKIGCSAHSLNGCVYAKADGIAPDGRQVGVSVENAQGVLQAGVVDVASGW